MTDRILWTRNYTREWHERTRRIVTTQLSTDLVEYHWTPQPEAAALVTGLLARQLEACPWLSDLARRMREETGTRLIDWICAIAVPADAALEQRLREAGFSELDTEDHALWRHGAGIFPQVITAPGGPRRVTLRVESVADFVVAQQLAEQVRIEGEPLASVRTARVCPEGPVECQVVEQHGTHALESETIEPQQVQAVLFHREAFRLRRRRFEHTAQGFEHARQLIDNAAVELGVSRTCDLFFAAERDYWQSRNRAARVQKSRQDRLGLGWANHDHHTYRSSRDHFTRLIAALESLGFLCRERFYAGETAGWGAQVLEQPDCGIVIFADVDLSPDEVTGDFAHEPLPPRDELGTVGLWCRLHGEAFLEAGMHHLECRFDYDAVRRQLAEAGVETMPPFTDLPYLKQAFTVGEMWPVERQRIESLLAERLISPDDAARFRDTGALGSHLEILQRDDGYKGFNQTGIDEIIRKTDPRKAD